MSAKPGSRPPRDAAGAGGEGRGGADGSPFIRWAKARSGLPYHLGASGVPPASVADIGAGPDDLAVSPADGDNLHGWPPLLERIAARYGVEEDRVVLAHGASMANHLAMSALVRPGDGVLVESPSYEPLRRLPAHLGAGIRTFPRRREVGWCLEVEAVRERMDGMEEDVRLIVLSTLHNPTGRRADEEALRRLGELALERDALVLVDEVYLEWLHPEGAETAARHPGVVATRSLTKAYGLDGLRLGWILAHSPEVAERIRRLKDLFSVTTAHPSERLAARALDRADGLLARGRERVRANLVRVRAFVDGRPELSWTPPDGGTVCFVRLRGGAVDELAARLEERGVSVAPGRFFGAKDHFRLGFGMEAEVLEEGLRRLGEVLDEMLAAG